MSDLALRYLKDSIGFLCSFITKERIRTQCLNEKGVKNDIYYMTVRLQQRKVQVKLLLRQSVMLSEMKRHPESLEVAREAVSESISMIFETLKLCYILLLKMDSLKTMKINKMYNGTNKYYFASKDYDNLMEEDEMNVMKRIKNSKLEENKLKKGMSGRLQVPGAHNRETTNRKRDKDFFDVKEREWYENLRGVIPILEVLTEKLKELANGLK